MNARPRMRLAAHAGAARIADDVTVLLLRRER